MNPSLGTYSFFLPHILNTSLLSSRKENKTLAGGVCQVTYANYAGLRHSGAGRLRALVGGVAAHVVHTSAHPAFQQRLLSLFLSTNLKH